MEWLVLVLLVLDTVLALVVALMVEQRRRFRERLVRGEAGQQARVEAIRKVIAVRMQ